MTGREPVSFLDTFIAKVGAGNAMPILRLLELGLYRALPYTPDSKLMAEQVASFIRQTQELRVRNLDALLVAELSGRLAAAIIAFSGIQSDVTNERMFETVAEMLLAGFEPRFGITQVVEPEPIELSKDELFPIALRAATALVCYYIDSVIRNERLDPENRASNSLQSSVAKLYAGKFGFDPEPRNVFQSIQDMIHTFISKTWINVRSVGQGDSIGQVLRYITQNSNGNSCYAFVVGSERSPVGCGTSFMETMLKARQAFVGSQAEVVS